MSSPTVGATRRERRLHPGAWWVWAIGMAIAAGRTTNPVLLALIIAIACVVVAARRTDAPWARSFGFFLRLGALIVTVRVLAQVVFGAHFGRTAIVNLPAVRLPDWLGGLSIGGVVTTESIAAAAVDGLRFAAIVICIGAATSLASPSGLLASVPAVLYEFGTSVVIATTFTPMLVEDVARVRMARRLRGSPDTGPRAIAAAVMPVLEGALERSTTLAAAMDSRGYGRRGTATPRQRRWSSAALLAGLVAAVIGSFGLMSPGAPGELSLLLLLAGSAAAVTGVVLAMRGSQRSRYRPVRWTARAWLVSACGLATALGSLATGLCDPRALDLDTGSLSWPAVPWAATLGIAVAVLPAFLAPAPDEAP